MFRAGTATIPLFGHFSRKSSIATRSSAYSLHPTPSHSSFLLSIITMSQGPSRKGEAGSQGIVLRGILGPNNTDSDRYEIGETLGGGSYGQVYRCKQRQTGAVSTGAWSRGFLPRRPTYTQASGDGLQGPRSTKHTNRKVLGSMERTQDLAYGIKIQIRCSTLRRLLQP